MVSNDFYTDHVRNLDEGAKGDVRVWLQHARISFAFVGTEFMLNPKRLTSYSCYEEVLFKIKHLVPSLRSCKSGTSECQWR
jgi:hypothetical protein